MDSFTLYTQDGTNVWVEVESKFNLKNSQGSTLQANPLKAEIPLELIDYTTKSGL